MHALDTNTVQQAASHGMKGEERDSLLSMTDFLQGL